MIAQMLATNRVAGPLAKSAEPAAVEAVDFELVVNPHAALVEQTVVVGTQTQNVVRSVGTAVRSSQGSDVSAFGDHSARHFQSITAHLAGSVEEAFDVIADLRAANNARDDTGVAARMIAARIRVNRSAAGGFFVWGQPDKPEAPDPEAAPSDLTPVRGDPVETVVAITRGGRLGGVTADAPNHTDREALKLTGDQSRVARLTKHLIGHLTATALSTSARIDDLIAEVFVILVAAADHD